MCSQGGPGRGTMNYGPFVEQLRETTEGRVLLRTPWHTLGSSDVCTHRAPLLKKQSQSRTSPSKAFKSPSWWMLAKSQLFHPKKHCVHLGGRSYRAMDAHADVGDVGAGGGSWPHTSGAVGNAVLGSCHTVYVSKEHSWSASVNPCCNTAPSDSTQNYALLFTLSCTSDYQGRCHSAFLNLKKKKLNAAVSALRNVRRNCFSLPRRYSSLQIWMRSSAKAAAHWQNTKCQAFVQAELGATHVEHKQTLPWGYQHHMVWLKFWVKKNILTAEKSPPENKSVLTHQQP